MASKSIPALCGDVPQIVKTGGDWLELGWSFGV